jgi:hypothetical protein
VHNATTKQRHAALRRRLGIFLGQAPRWVREKKARLARLGEQAVAALTPVHGTLAPVRAALPAALTSVRVTAALPAPLLASVGALAAADEPTERVALPPAAVAAPAPPTPARPALARAGATTERFRAPAPRPLAIATYPSPAPGGRREPRAWHFALPIAVAIGAAVVAGRVHSSPEAREPDRVAPAPAAGAALASAAAPLPPAAEPARPRGVAAASGAVVIIRGDTLWDLAARHLGDARRWPSLHQANRAAIADPDLIYPGQELALPTR